MARPSGPEVWVMLLEKAIAKSKYFGTYAAMEGGLLGFGLKIITGAQVFCWVQQDDGSGWKKFDVRAIEAGRKTCDIVATQDEAVAGDQMFKDLTQWVKDGFVIGAGSTHSQQDAGIMPGHAYSVLRTFMTKDGKTRLLNVRNPWGSFAWKGDFSHSIVPR